MKRAVTVVFLLLVALASTGFKNFPEIKERVLVGALICDGEGGDFHLAALCYTPEEQQGSGYGSFLVSASGESCDEAFLRLLRREPMLFFDHMAAVVVGGEAVNFGFGTLLATMENYGVPDKAGIFLYEGSCIGLPEQNFGGGTALADQLDDALEQQPVNVFRVQRSFAAGFSARLPVLELYLKAISSDGEEIMGLRVKNSAELAPYL